MSWMPNDEIMECLENHPLFDQDDFYKYQAENEGATIVDYVDHLQDIAKAKEMSVYKGD